MALNPIIDSRDCRFLLFEMLELEKFSQKFPAYSDFDKDTYEEILDLAERLAVEQLFEASVPGDREGCHHDPATKSVKIPPSY